MSLYPLLGTIYTFFSLVTHLCFMLNFVLLDRIIVSIICMSLRSNRVITQMAEMSKINAMLYSTAYINLMNQDKFITYNVSKQNQPQYVGKRMKGSAKKLYVTYESRILGTVQWSALGTAWLSALSGHNY